MLIAMEALEGGRSCTGQKDFFSPYTENYV